MAANSSSLGSRAIAATAPTTDTLTIDLAPSNSPCGPKRFLAPDSGLIRLGSGLMACVRGLPPTWATLTSTPATTHTRITGAVARPTDVACAASSAPSPRWPTTDGVAISVKTSCISRCRTSKRFGAVALSAISAASNTTALLRSIERGIWPFLRASSRRLGVAFSVLSPAMSGHPERLEGGADAALQLVGDPAGGEGQRHADDEQ